MTFSRVQKKELLYLAMMVMASGDNYTLPDLMQIMDRRTMLNVIRVFGGRYIRVPSSKELEKAIRLILYYYYTKIEGKKETDVVKELNINGYSLRWIKHRIKSFKGSHYKIPKEFCKSEILKELNKSLWKQKIS